MYGGMRIGGAANIERSGLKMNRRSFIARCVAAVTAVLFPWKPAEGLTVAEIRTAKEALDAQTTFAEVASKFQWNCTYVQVRGWLIQCWGEFQDGRDYECAEFVDFDGECDDYGNAYAADNPEAILSEIAITFDQAMRRRFDQIENDSPQSS